MKSKSSSKPSAFLITMAVIASFLVTIILCVAFALYTTPTQSNYSNLPGNDIAFSLLIIGLVIGAPLIAAITVAVLIKKNKKS